MVTAFPADPTRVVGGVAGVARTLAPHLAARAGLELRVFAPGHPAARSARVDGVSVEYLTVAPGPGFLAYWTLERRRIHAALRRFAPDLVHVQAVGGWALGWRGPWVLTVHGLGERDVLHSALPLRRLRSRVIARVEAAARRRAPHVIRISPFVGEALGGQLAGRVWSIDNPVDDGFFRVERREAEGRVAFVGRLSALKNLLGLLEAFAAVAERHPAAELHVAGDAAEPDYAARCRARAEDDPRLRGRVHFLGSLDVNGVQDLLAGASCLVLPSHHEVAPLVVAEAMAAGVPVLASRRGGIPHLLDHGDSGLLFDPDRTGELESGLDALLGDAQLRRNFAERGRAAAAERFRAARVAERTEQVYRAALGTGAAQAG